MLMLHSLCSFLPFDRERNRVVTVRAFHFYGVPVPPRIFPVKLQSFLLHSQLLLPRFTFFKGSHYTKSRNVSLLNSNQYG